VIAELEVARPLWHPRLLPTGALAVRDCRDHAEVHDDFTWGYSKIGCERAYLFVIRCMDAGNKMGLLPDCPWFSFRSTTDSSAINQVI
jgi:hypothetical protein